MAADDPNEAPETGLNGVGDLARAFLGLLRKQAWVLVLIAAGVIAVEVGLRVLRPDMAGLVYAADQTGGHPIALSDKSFRIPEGRTGPTTPAIIAIGDSTTFGTGVGAEETWPLLLGAMSDVWVPVANAGFPGGEPALLVQGLRGAWAQPEPPKVVMLLVTGNMISFTHFRRDVENRDPLRRVATLQRNAQRPAGFKQRLVELVQASAVWKSLSLNVEIFKYAIGLLNHRTDPSAPLSPLLAYGWQQPDIDGDFLPEMWQLFEEEITLLQRETDALGACLVIGFLPPRFALSDQVTDNLKFVPKTRLTLDAAQGVAQIADTLGVPFVDTTEPLAKANAERGFLAPALYIPGDYTHLSAAGHAVVADAFLGQLTPDLDCDRSP